MAEIETENFQSRNNDYFKSTLTKLDILIEKLRQKCKWLKTEWTNKTISAKNGSGLDPEKESHWYQILNPIFPETHKPLNLVSSAAQTSFVNENSSDSSLEEHDNDDDDESKPVSFSRSDGTDLNNLDAEDKQADDDAPRRIHQNVRQADKPPLRKKSKIAKPPHKKSEKIKSTTHGLSAIARGINASIAAQDKRFERQLKENAERERRLLAFRASEAEKDHQHEARMAQLLMSLKSSHPSPQYG